MRIEEFKANLEKRSIATGLKYRLGLPASNDAITRNEEKHNILFPGQVKTFYKHHNGLVVDNPCLEIMPIEKISKDTNGNIHFACFDGNAISFDISRINEADQWDIINTESHFLVTKTMASLWSNKIFAFIDKNRMIWEEEKYS